MSTSALIDHWQSSHGYYMHWDGYPSAVIPALINFLEKKSPLEHIHIFPNEDMPKVSYTYIISYKNCIVIKNFQGEVIFEGTIDQLKQWIKEYTKDD